jgi:hypothetical protein
MDSFTVEPRVDGGPGRKLRLVSSRSEKRAFDLRSALQQLIRKSVRRKQPAIVRLEEPPTGKDGS